MTEFVNQLAGLFGNRNFAAFNSLEFLFRFLPLFLALYYMTPDRFKNLTLVAGSLLFYALGDPMYTGLLAAAGILNFLLAVNVWPDGGAYIGKEKRRKIYFVLAFILDAGLLSAFKLLHAFDAGAALPLGISFYTFRLISFQADAYRGKTGRPRFVRFCAYLSMFPQLVSGPIMRYTQAQEALKKRHVTWEMFEDGLEYFVLGLAAKVLLADRLGLLWNELQTIGFESISTPLAWLGAASYSLELYFDFAGYSLMAAGLGVMLGFPFIRNFFHPYSAGSIRAFFRRWHITLQQWFRDYIYIPLGGSRCGRGRNVLNLAVVWLLTGLWHGGSLNFVLWGMLIFAAVAAEKLFLGAFLDRHAVLSRIYVFFFMMLAWVTFAITDLGQLGVYFTRLFPFFGGAGMADPSDFFRLAGRYGLFLTAGAVCCVPAVYRWYDRSRKSAPVLAGLLFLFWCSVYLLSNAVNNPFLYFSF